MIPTTSVTLTGQQHYSWPQTTDRQSSDRLEAVPGCSGCNVSECRLTVRDAATKMMLKNKLKNPACLAMNQSCWDMIFSFASELKVISPRTPFSDPKDINAT